MRGVKESEEENSTLKKNVSNGMDIVNLLPTPSML